MEFDFIRTIEWNIKIEERNEQLKSNQFVRWLLIAAGTVTVLFFVPVIAVGVTVQIVKIHG